MTHATAWARPRPSAWLDPLRGTDRRARRRRRHVMVVDLMFLLMIGLVMILNPVLLLPLDGRQRSVATAAVVVALVIGVAVVGVVAACRPIGKTTWRAAVAGWWHTRPERRNAVNAGGYPSARARRRVVNKAAWSAQRQRSGRAARPAYGTSLRRRIVES